jgi:hypothetical protein
MAPDRLTRAFTKLAVLEGCRRSGCTTFGTARPAGLSAGVELKVVQEMFGHSSIVLTADTYTSVLPDAAHAAAEKVAALPGTKRCGSCGRGRQESADTLRSYCWQRA